MLELKELIYAKNINLDANNMGLAYAGIFLEDKKKLNEYVFAKDSKISQSKGSLSSHPGLLLSYEPDMISLDDD